MAEASTSLIRSSEEAGPTGGWQPKCGKNPHPPLSPSHPACSHLHCAQQVHPRSKNVQPPFPINTDCRPPWGHWKDWDVGAGRDDGRSRRKDDGLRSELAVFPCPASVEIRGTEKPRSPQEAQSSQAGLLGVCLGI